MDYSLANPWTGHNLQDDPIHNVLQKLLATEDLAEFDALSAQLRSMLHERIERLRKEAKSLNSNGRNVDRQRRSRDGTTNKP